MRELARSDDALARGARGSVMSGIGCNTLGVAAEAAIAPTDLAYMQQECNSGAPIAGYGVPGDCEQHPDGVTSNAAIWATLGDPMEAFAMLGA